MDDQFSDKLIENLDTSFKFELINPEIICRVYGVSRIINYRYASTSKIQ